MARRGTALAFAVALLIVLWLIWSRLRIVIWLHASLWQVLLVFGAMAIILFLWIDHLLNRTRRNG